MSRKLTSLLLAMLILAGAMTLKTVVSAHSNGAVMMANGAAPVPPPMFRNGAAPVPPPSSRNGAAPVPPPSFRNGAAPVPPPSAQ
ncbi:MAG: hypothetical protein JWO71_1254 [Candidatus Acidoferrum typicum]|nr:hypothetical protein [Candidatus Acidoferrum typicum]